MTDHSEVDSAVRRYKSGGKNKKRAPVAAGRRSDGEVEELADRTLPERVARASCNSHIYIRSTAERTVRLMVGPLPCVTAGEEHKTRRCRGVTYPESYITQVY